MCHTLVSLVDGWRIREAPRVAMQISRLRHATEDSRAPTWRTVLPEALRADPFVENLERRLTTLDRTGVDPVRLIADALAQPQPLPVEHPAGALWWRIVRRVDPTALRGAGVAQLRPKTNASARSPSGPPSSPKPCPASTRTSAGRGCSTRSTAPTPTDTTYPNSSPAHSPHRPRWGNAAPTTCAP